MFNLKSTLNCVIVLSAFVGFLFVVGCGSSAEKQKMTEFLQNYGQTVDEYSSVVSKADNTKKTELEGKLENLMNEWTNIKIDMGSEITPQVLDKLENEYKVITKKYKTLAGKS